MSSILVTGALGFIGSHIVEELVSRGHDVVGLDDLSGGVLDNQIEGATYDINSILNHACLDKLFTACKFDYVVHAAAYAAEGLSPYIRRFNYENNLIGSVNIINACLNHNVKHLTFLSSIAVYGDNCMFEDFGCETPIDPYGISKLAVELDIQAANKQFGLNYTVFRPHNVYGERQNLNDKYRNVVAIFMRAKLKNTRSTIFGDGNQTRSFTYVKDIVPAICDSLKSKKMQNGIFNIGSDNSYTINEIANILQLKKISYVAERHEVKHTNPDHGEINAITKLGETTLRQGITQMWNWAKTQTLQEPKVFKIELNKKTPWS